MTSLHRRHLARIRAPSHFLGIDSAAQQILVCKSAIGWRAAFGDIAKAHVFVDTPGICASDLRQFDYTHDQSAMFPLDPDAAWPG